MKIVEVKERTPDLIKGLLEVWENSVRATHLFLSDSEIQSIKKYVPQALNEVLHLLIAEDESGRAVAFMGVEAGSLEMLFIAPEERGKGLGKRLIQYGIKNYSVEKLTVNEQNPQAGQSIPAFVYEASGDAVKRITGRRRQQKLKELKEMY